MILAGGALGIGYPWAAANLGAPEIGIWRVYEREAGFSPAEVDLAGSGAAFAAVVELTTRGPLARGDYEPVLTVAADASGRTVLAQALDFETVEPRTINPQSGELLYRMELPRIDAAENGRFVFTFGPGTVAEDQLVAVDLTLSTASVGIDPRAIPAGYVLLAVGLVGFIASFGRRRPQNPNSSPPPPRWGRGE